MIEKVIAGVVLFILTSLVAYAFKVRQLYAVVPLHGGLSAQFYSANMTSDNSHFPTFKSGFSGVLDTSSSFKPSSYKAGGSIVGSVALELGSTTRIK